MTTELITRTGVFNKGDIIVVNSMFEGRQAIRTWEIDTIGRTFDDGKVLVQATCKDDWRKTKGGLKVIQTSLTLEPNPLEAWELA